MAAKKTGHRVARKSKLGVRGAIAGRARRRVDLQDDVRILRARGHFVHTRPKLVHDRLTGEFLENPDGTREFGPEYNGRIEPAYRDELGIPRIGQRFVAPDVLDPRDHVELWAGDSLNVKTTVGIDFTFLQTYGTSGLGSNGLNYIGLSNDTLTETSGSTTLSNEITTNGLARAQATYAHTAGASTATLTHVFTATGTQSCQKAALFSASSSGTMNHALSFTQRNLLNGDSITITDTITIT